ncbi:MAG TPA: M48 family metalloprotease [Thermohalobaculum sp.]|nr:M48 family metalloprotease [Thermohalobaculum sp.]
MILNLLRLCIALVVPTGALFLSSYLDGNPELLEEKTISFLCILDTLVTHREIACLAQEWVGPFRDTAWLAFGLGAAPLFVFFGVAILCGTRRSMNAAVFPLMIPVAIVLVCANMLVQGVLVLGVVVLVYTAHVGNPPIFALFFAAAAIAGGALAVIGGAVTMRFSQALEVRGLAIKRSTSPRLWALVDDLAARLGADPPDAIVIGLEPTFWVVSGKVRASGTNLPTRLIEGRTLFVSLPLMRVLADEEFRAIIAHELGHFRGRDTEYSARFIPAYQALEGAETGFDDAAEIGGSGPPIAVVLAWIARMPARALLAMLHAAFHGNVQRISRFREYEADAAAAEVADPRAVATSLFKIPLYSRLWDNLIEDHINRIRRKLPTAPELGTFFGDMARLMVTPDLAVALREYALEARSEHPFDSHPSSYNRVSNLGIDPATVTPAELRTGENDGVAEALIDKLDEVEFFLMTAENDALYECGATPHVPATLNMGGDDPLYHAIYSLLAVVVGLAPDTAPRFTAVVARAQAAMDDFDRLIFAGYCGGHRDVLPVDEAAARLRAGGEARLLAVMEVATAAIADSGAEPGQEEIAVLSLLDPGQQPEPEPTAPGDQADRSVLDEWFRDMQGAGRTPAGGDGGAGQD